MVRLPAPAVANMQGDDAIAVPGLEIVAEVGRGAHAVVYRVRRDDRDFALKVLRPSGDQTHATVAFRREAGLVACVNHPGVAHVHEVGEVGGRPYLVMDLIEGESLSRLVDDGWPDQARTIAVGMDVAGALAAAHQVGVVHRDVTPHNIVVSADGRARLIDFGLAAQPGPVRCRPMPSSVPSPTPRRSRPGCSSGRSTDAPTSTGSASCCSSA